MDKENLENNNENENVQKYEQNNNPEEDKSNDDTMKTPKKEPPKTINDKDSEEINLSKPNSQIYESEGNYLSDAKDKKDPHNSTPIIPFNNLLNKDEKENKYSLDISSLQNIRLNDFKEEYLAYPRQYNEDTRKYGTKFFYYRYLKENTIERDREDYNRKKTFLLIIIEKSIFYFNHRKYKESIELLLNEKIIKHNKEFGEFIFVINGFDKNIISDFFSDDKLPNEININEIIVSFLNCVSMDFNNNSFMNTLKFLLSNINNPNKEIIDKFCLKYFKKFKDNEIFVKNFKTGDIFSALIHSIIKIFVGKDKNKKMDQFIKENKNLDKKLCQSIFKEMQLQPFISTYNYIQKFYKKLSNLVIETDEREKKNKSSDIDSYYENILDDKPKRDYNNHYIWFNYRKNISTFTEEDKEILLNPILFTKFVTNSTTSHPRVFAFRKNFKVLIWAKSIEGEKTKGNLHSLNIEDISDIYLGVDNCEIIKRFIRANNKEIEEEYNYLTVRTKNEVFVIKAEDSNISFLWFKAVKSLLSTYQTGMSKDKERIVGNNLIKSEKELQKIWNNGIFHKWTEYGRYLLYKKQNKVEYKKVLNSIIKKEKIKSNLINDTFNFNNKKIYLFLNEVKNYLIGEGKENNMLDLNEFLFLYKIGIPHHCRSIIWDSLIDNSCGITKDIFDIYSNQINGINFEEIIKNNDIIKELYEDDVQKIIIDIIKIEDFFINDIFDLKKKSSEILSKIYKLIRIFFLMRKDIPYNKNIINYAFIFVFVFEDEYLSFKNLYNFICSSNIIKYFTKDEVFIAKNCNFFKTLMSKHCIRVFHHFSYLYINNDLFSIFWFENLFTQTLNYKILLRIFDLFLIYGDELLFQIGLAMIKIQEEDLLNYPINEIFKVLKRLPNKFDEEIFFENLDLINIHDEYNNYIVANTLDEQFDFLCSE